MELVAHERRDVVEITNTVCNQLFLNRNEQVFLQHSLDDVLRRTEHVVVLVSHFDLRQSGLVDVESLVNEFHFLARLVEIPLLEISLDVLVNVIRPVQHFELMCTV